MKTLILLVIVASLATVASDARADTKPDVRLGSNVSDCGKGNPPLWMSRTFKTKKDRDVFRGIAENVGAVGPQSETSIDTALLDEKLRSVVGDKRVICTLTLRPSGRVEAAKILKSSGDAKSDRNTVAFLKHIDKFGANGDTHRNVSYEVELPHLRVSQMQP